MSPTPEQPETGRPNLRRALQSLPTHAPDDALWPRLAAQLDAEAPLRRAIAQLPTHEPDPAAWAQIVSSFSDTNDEAPAWPTLPSHAPDDALWDAIAARLDAPAAAPVAQPAPPAVVRQLWPPTATVRQLAALAASLLLVAAVWLLRPVSTAGSGPHETVAYSQETVAALPTPALSFAPDPLEAEGLAFIDAHCQSLPAVCQSADFQSLRSQLDELEAEARDLSRYAQQHGASPELVRNQVKIVKLKASVTRELIQLLIS